MSKSEKKMTSIGGQAVLEGVMMRGPESSAIAVRKPDGSIVIKTNPTNSFVKRIGLAKIPILRGVVSFFESMIVGVKATMYSAEFVDLESDEAEEPSKLDQWLEKHFGEKLMPVIMWISVAFALVMSVGLFMLFPTVVAGFIKNLFTNETFVKFPQQFIDAVQGFFTNRIFLNLMEACVRISLFALYMWAVSHMKDMQRVFAYHGAEHKVIACYEDGAELTPENAKTYTRFHPRCGTNFLLIVMVMSILLFSVLTWDGVWIRILMRLALMPVVAGLSYEVIKFAGRSQNKCVKFLIRPGLALQKFTTREPDESQLAVAIASLEAVLPKEEGADNW